MARRHNYASGLSVQQFRDLLNAIPTQVGVDIAQAVEDEADALVQAMKAKAPVRTGNLRASIRMNRSAKSPFRFIIRAGGRLTTKEVRKGSGVPYDYALGTEWGTQKESPHPFFYSTARARRPGARRRISERAKIAIIKGWS